MKAQSVYVYELFVLVIIVNITQIFSAWKLDCEILTPDQCKDKCPLLNTSDLYGGIWIPGDGVGDPYKTCISLVSEAKRMG